MTVGTPLLPLLSGGLFLLTRVYLLGCMFEHTVTRELYMTALVNKLMSAQHIPTANTPIGTGPHFSLDAFIISVFVHAFSKTLVVVRMR